MAPALAVQVKVMAVPLLMLPSAGPDLVNVPGATGRLVSEKLGEPLAPLVAAVTLYGPPAVPLALAEALAEPPMMATGLKAKVALAPAPGAVKVTRPPFTGSPKELETFTTSELAKAVLTTADCGLPLP